MEEEDIIMRIASFTVFENFLPLVKIMLDVSVHYENAIGHREIKRV